MTPFIKYLIEIAYVVISIALLIYGFSDLNFQRKKVEMEKHLEKIFFNTSLKVDKDFARW